MYIHSFTRDTFFHCHVEIPAVHQGSSNNLVLHRQRQARCAWSTIRRENPEAQFQSESVGSDPAGGGMKGPTYFIFILLENSVYGKLAQVLLSRTEVEKGIQSTDK